MSDFPYVDWAPVATGVYVAKSASVFSVEECPLCKKAMETEPDILGEVVCLGSHSFKVDDDGESYSLTYTDAIRPKRASTKYERQDDGAYVASLNSNSFSCPTCQSPIDVGQFGQKTASDVLWVTCSQGHDFEAYMRLPKIWMYESNVGPFDTSEKKIAKVAGTPECHGCGASIGLGDTCSSCGMEHDHRGFPRCQICGEGIRMHPNGYYSEDAGEFWDPDQQKSVLAHAQCGLDSEFDIA